MKNSRYYPYERNRYFYGKLLTVRDFESEQKYFNDKRRLSNRLLHGSGVACGLQVVAVDDKTISLETGVAIDYAGREIVVASPFTQKLSMIEGFTSNEYAQNIYLCIAYDEKGKEPVHSVAGSSTRPEEVSEYNRIQESYRLFIREEAPDPSSFGFSRLLDDVVLVYQDKQLRIWQKTPRYVNPSTSFNLTLIIEKNLQLPRLELEYVVKSECFVGLDGKSEVEILFAEPEHGRETVYEVKIPLDVLSVPDTVDRILIKNDNVKLKIGERQFEVEAPVNNTVQICSSQPSEKVMRNYRAMNLDQYLEALPEQPIYLAKINLLQIGSTFMIEKVESLPFNEYIYNTGNLYSLGLLSQESKGNPKFTSRASVSMLTPGDEPRFQVKYDQNSQEFDFRLGIPQIKPVVGEASSGLVELELEASLKAGKSYFSEEIDHGLGKGPVFIVTGVEESTDEELMEIPQHSEQIFFGAYEVFHKSPYDSIAPRLAIGTVVYPQKGTFRVGVRCQTTKITHVRIRWWAYRKPADS
ncbi:MAG: hypothetical protein PHC92_04725 [Syntrophomonadaceae bacterium]|nr:hypothetical protein [Syntrophomonadaceae bacterium]MDD3023037.1 hypothetical protein [Syntrophomonadaceae bacterium]